MGSFLSRLLDRGAEDRPCVVDARGSHSYAEVVANAWSVAHALSGADPRIAATPGRERVAILVSPGADFVSTLFGVLAAGAVVVILSPLHPERESRYFCGDAGVRTLLYSEDLVTLAQATTASSAVSARPIAPILGTRHPAGPLPSLTDDTPALQLYTSGTTGRPKGAVISHGNLGVQQSLVGDAWGFSERDTLLHTLPLHHMHGLAIALFTALGAGATTRMIPFDPASVFDAMADATVFMGVPAMYHRLFATFDAANDTDRARWTAHARALRLATSGSAALPVTLAERWRTITGQIPLERFGMTEIGVGISNPLHGPRLAGTVGLPLPTVEARILDDHGAPASTGELWIRGPSVFLGYHERPEETKAAFQDDPDGGRPWFRTGDTVTRDAATGDDRDAPFRILGRTSVDILKSGGYKLSALEIEEVLREHPAVSEVAVVGVPDEAWGDRVVACVVFGAAASCDGDTLRAFLKERLAAYKVPKEIIPLPALPKNALGKVVKPELVRQIARI